MTGAQAENVLEICGLRTSFLAGSKRAVVVDDLSFNLRKGEILGIVGESGSGKSVTLLSVMGLLPERVAKVEAGSAVFAGRDLIAMPFGGLRDIRGNRVAFIFQEPMSSFNPVLTVGSQIAEALTAHGLCSQSVAKDRAISALQAVQMPEADKRFDQYPHEFSGGMLQRAMIAMALACHPEVLIADEPTTALDVTIQAQVLQLIRDLRDEQGMSIILISHDLGVIAEMADRVVVMYGGRKMEEADVFTLFEDCQHPYTQGLLAANPAFEAMMDASEGAQARLTEIPGSMPSPLDRASGCNFAPRCSLASKTCSEQRPEERQIGEGHLIRCWNSGDAND
ncbi:ABC transporter ATP-binding protein [Hoeflea prorocentri]|uniref:ABC transporter ATP-binding protein n=1 Tax=Hoeflea prorocentri TaxID=1922333 RepID=A0A9X3ZI06_9HYPH|nr:ABC transporter ATP-binding protein [Hoeflea prorocentri]MCY6381914.1 ABC transporter ATP-binding protein [Hoeflea prorocentri]MDA5399714.1 ABC transporter ATP-binding protein [Hoeflea prorocentri]